MRHSTLIAVLISMLAVAAQSEPTDSEGGEVEEIVVTGVRTGILAQDPATFATSIDLSDFLGEQKSLDELLSQSVGVQVRRFGGPGERSEVSIRGSTTDQVVVLLDGVRMNSEFSGGVDLSTFPAELLDRVEIVRGGGAVEQGSGAIGGVINLVSRRPDDDPVTSFTVAGGSFGTWKGSVFHSARYPIVDITLGYAGFKTDGDYDFVRPVSIGSDGSIYPSTPATATRINNRIEKHDLTLGLGREVGDDGYLRLREYLTYGSQGEPGLDLGSGRDAGQRAFAHQREFRSVTHLEWRGTDPTPLHGDAEASLYYRFTRNHFTDPAPALGELPIDSELDLTEGGLKLRDGWSSDHTWFGVSFSQAPSIQVDSRRDALHGNEQGNIDRWTAGISVAEELRFRDDTVLLAPAVRLDWTQGFDTNWIPRLGASWSPFPWLRFRGNIERSFRAPSFSELYFPDKGYIRGNPDLDAERARNADVGLELIFDELGWLGKLGFSGSYFHNAIDESIVWILYPTFIEPENTGPATIQGAELSLDLAPLSWLLLSTNYTFVDATRDATGAPLPGRARHEASARFELRDLGVWKLVAEYHYTGQLPLTNGGAAWIESQSTWDVSGSLNFAANVRIQNFTRLEKLWLTVKVTNIGDESLRDARFYPRPGRAMMIALEGGW